ncbi:T9SS type A sorting domain-containing protein [Labilibacter marinus]|uniref:T9SS type A sorting domain-containing protein n=1 Tax=Labilibacter marinus TaxID=1477105 RepID=UPI000832695B|nr:T9SS type A sorting domain-containing protein [Labilibacter marinus]
MKKSTFFVAFLFLATQIYSQALGWNNNRIAVSADGNNQPDNLHKWPKGDPDDYGGTPAAFAMLAKAELQEYLVHYSYNNFMEAPAHTTATNQMKIAADYAIANWGFDASTNGIMDASTNNAAAVTHLAIEIGKSTASDPLYYFNMGPSEMFYRAVQKAIDNGKIDNLTYVHIISHSGYNDNHLRRGDPNFDLQPVADEDKHHTMDEAVALSGDRLNYHKIKDQNSLSDNDAGFAAKEGGVYDYSVFHWMRDHQDPGVKFIYDRMVVSTKADCSDAGMIFYLIQNDENGNSVKFKNFIGNGIMEDIPVPSDCEDVSYNGVDDFDFTQVSGLVPCYKDDKWPSQRYCVGINAAAYKDQYGAVTKVFDGETGMYDVTITSLLETDGECSYRLRVGGELIGEFQNIESTTDYTKYTHTFKDVTVKNGDVIQVESNTHSNGKVLENEDEPGIYAYARGRWETIVFTCLGTTIDPEDCNVEEEDGLLVFEAERIELKGSWKLGTDETFASGGKYIYFDGANKYQGGPAPAEVLTYSFKINTAGTYAFRWFVRQSEEERGKVTGQQGTDLANDAWVYFQGDIGLLKGNTLTSPVKCLGRSDPGFWLMGNAEQDHEQGEINVAFPEAGTYTVEIGGRSHGFQIDKIVIAKKSEYNLWDYVKMTEATAGKYWSETSDCASTPDPNPDPEPEPDVESVSFVNPPAEVSTDATTISLDYNYSVNEERRVFFAIYDTGDNFVKNISARISEGSGTGTLTVTLDAPLAIAENYIFRMFLRPLVGNYSTNYAAIEQNFNVVSVVTDINDESTNSGSFKAYPNPVKNTLFVNLSDFSDATISVIDLSGQTIKYTTVTSELTQINVSDITPGVYILSVENQSKKEQKRILIH